MENSTPMIPPVVPKPEYASPPLDAAVCTPSPPAEETAQALVTTGEKGSAAPDEEARSAPPPFAPTACFRDGLTAFGFSQQGESHRKKGAPCQDSGGIRFLNCSPPIVLAAVADGVGSCALSQYGSAVAVQTALELLYTELEDHTAREDFVFADDDRMKDLLSRAFEAAVSRVDEMAREMEQLPFSFMTTLTVAAFDGKTLYYGHAGDDGIVVLCGDGSYEMVTRRHKGDTANSVIPLQAGLWDFGRVRKPVVSFAMATDGVLDSVVGSSLFNNRVYYPFFEPIFETKLEGEADVDELCESLNSYMHSHGYRQQVSDDLTIVAVTNQNALTAEVKTSFDQSEWDRKTQEVNRKVREQIYASSAQDDEPDPVCEDDPQRTHQDKEERSGPDGDWKTSYGDDRIRCYERMFRMGCRIVYNAAGQAITYGLIGTRAAGQIVSAAADKGLTIIGQSPRL